MTGDQVNGADRDPADLFVPAPSHRAVTLAEVTELRRRARPGDELEVVPHRGGLAIVCRGDGDATWALRELAAMRADPMVPGSVRPTPVIDIHWAGRVTRGVVRRAALEQLDLGTPWEDLPAPAQAHWQELAELVWAAHEFGGGEQEGTPDDGE